MLSRILEWSLQNRVLVVAGWASIAVAGAASLLELPLDAFPDTTPVQVQVNAAAPALGPLEIERRITIPMERVVGGLPHLENVRSVSKFGFAQLTLTFEEGTDIWLARQVVAERMQALDIDALEERPTLGPVATGLGEVFHYVVRSESRTAAELRTLQEWMIAPQLRAVPGVAEVNSWGGDERRFEVVVDPLELARYELGLRDVAAAVEANQAVVGGGYLESGGQATIVRGTAVVERPDQIEEMIVAVREGVPLRVRDVATVAIGRQVRRGAVTSMGRGEAVLGLGFMRMGENSHEVTRLLDARLSEIARGLPAGVEVEVVYARTTLVDQVLRTVRNNLLEGAAFVVLVLFLFLGDWRAGLIVATAIPLAVLFAGNLMLAFGVAGSLMSLGAIDFGLVVDSAVIQIENAVKRLSEDASGRSRLEIVRDAVLEVRGPTMFGELIIAIVYVPILALTGIEGQLFRPMALTVLFALGGSMLLSLTLIPVVASVALSRRPSHREPPAVRGARWLYAPLLDAGLRWPKATLALAGLFVVLGVGVGRSLGAEFIPRLGEGTLVANSIRMAGVSVDESVRYGTLIERALLAEFPDEIERVWTRTGTAEVTTDPMGIELSDVFIQLHPRDEWTRAETQDELVSEMSELLETFPGTRIVLTQPIEMRMNEMSVGVRADLGIYLFGEDLDVLRGAAGDVERILARIEGAEDVSVEQVTGQPMLTVDVDRSAVARHGIAAGDVLLAVEAFAGHPIGTAQVGEIPVPIALVLDPHRRADVESIGAIQVRTAAGDYVPLRRIARLEVFDGPSTISREWGRRRILVQANVRGRDLAGFVEEARAAVDRELDVPEGYDYRLAGQFEHLERARARLMFVVPLALGLIVLLLYLTYGRLLDALRVFVGVPFAMVGGVIALSMRGMPFSISAAVGFIALSGVAVLGDMVLVSTIRQLEQEGRPLRDAVRDAALARLRPVLMTSLVAGLGFLPMALSDGIGAEVQRPLATVVIGGLVTSTITTVVVLPVLYLLTARRSHRPQAASAGAAQHHGGA